MRNFLPSGIHHLVAGNEMVLVYGVDGNWIIFGQSILYFFDVFLLSENG